MTDSELRFQESRWRRETADSLLIGAAIGAAGVVFVVGAVLALWAVAWIVVAVGGLLPWPSA